MEPTKIPFESQVDLAFEVLLVKLLGQESEEIVLEILSTNRSEDFLLSYAYSKINELSFLNAKFNQDFVIQSFRSLDIEFVPQNRPVVLFDVIIDNGFASPYVLTNSKSEKSINQSIQNILEQVGEERGIFLELPVDTLRPIQDEKLQFEKVKNFYSEYDYDFLETISIERQDLNEWVLSDKEVNLSFKNIDLLLEYFQNNLQANIYNYLSTFKVSNDSYQIEIVFSNISDKNTFESLIDFLNKNLVVKEFSIKKFVTNTLTIEIESYGQVDQLLSSLLFYQNIDDIYFDDQNQLNKEYISNSYEKFIRKLEGLNFMTFLSEIITSSFVFGFLPILAFLFLILKIPKLTIFTSFCLINCEEIMLTNDSKKNLHSLFDNPIFSFK